MTSRYKPGEELIDAYVDRPLAAYIVKAVLPTRITPNMLTLTGMVIGASSGFWFAHGTMPYMAIGALCLFASMVIDCSDGQLARARNGGSRTGRILDGLSDYIVGISVHCGLAVALIGQAGMQTGTAWLLAIVVMISTAAQCFMLDYYRAKGIIDGTVDELAAAHDDLARARAATKRPLAELLLLPLYIGYTRAQQAFSSIGRSPVDSSEEAKPMELPSPQLLNRLSFVGPSTHNILIALTAIAGVVFIVPYFVLVLIVGNLYLGWVLLTTDH